MVDANPRRFTVDSIQSAFPKGLPRWTACRTALSSAVVIGALTRRSHLGEHGIDRCFLWGAVKRWPWRCDALHESGCGRTTHPLGQASSFCFFGLRFLTRVSNKQNKGTTYRGGGSLCLFCFNCRTTICRLETTMGDLARSWSDLSRAQSWQRATPLCFKDADYEAFGTQPPNYRSSKFGISRQELPVQN